MSEMAYFIAAVAISGLITLALRAIPFAVLKRLRGSRFVQALGRWMPAGILLILAVVVLRDQVLARPGQIWAICAATAITVAVHIFGKRRALLSIAVGTASYIAFINLF